jgi:DNA polymerase-4
MKTALRKIIHIDMDAFYASVEQRDDPKLRGKPVIVGGKPDSRGVVAAASYEARKFGVRSAMSCARAHRLCPRGIFVRPDISKYARVSREIRAIFESVTPLVEPLSLDEAYLDVTENFLGEPLAGKVAAHLRARIKKELRLTASAGVGPNKFIAKVASDLKKPDGLVIVHPDKAADFVVDLPIERFWGVGPATAKVLNKMGIFNGRDLRKKSKIELEKELGRFGPFLYDLSRGIDHRPVEPGGESKSCGSETTFEKDIRDIPLLVKIVSELASDVAKELHKMNRPGRTVTLKLRYSDFKTITRSRTMPGFLDDDQAIADVAADLLLSGTEAGRRPARLIGVSVSNLRSDQIPEQLVFPFK